MIQKEVVMQEKVIEIISESLGIKKEEITLENKLTEDLGADSLDLVELTLMLEEEFEIEIPEEAAVKIVTVEDVVECVERIKKQ